MNIIKIVVEVLKATFEEWQRDKAPRMAAALAYYTMFSLAPLIIIITAITGFILGQETVSIYLIQQAQDAIGPAGAEIIQSIIENASQPRSTLIATIIGIGTLLLGAIGVFVQLQDALNTVWAVAPKPGLGIKGFLLARLLSFGFMLGIGFLLLLSLILSSVVVGLDSFLASWLPDSGVFLLQTLNFVMSFGVVTLLFAMIFKFLPDVHIAWSDVWMGAIVTTLLFSLGKFLMGFYLGRQTFGSVYGAAGSILVLLLWVYYSAQIVLFGAEFTRVYAKRFGSKIASGSGSAVALNVEQS